MLDIVSYILGMEASGGGGGGGDLKQITDATLQDDGSLLIEYEDATTLTVIPTYTSDKITSIKIGDKDYSLTYNGTGELIKIADTDVDLSEYVGVGIIPTGTSYIYSNGSYDIGQYKNINVQVASGDGASKGKKEIIPFEFTLII